MVNNIIFDFDGTLIDTEKFYINNFCEIMKEYGIKCDDEDRHNFCGKGPYDKAEIVMKKYNITFDSEVSTKKYRDLNLERFPKDPSNLIFDDVLDTLIYLTNRNINCYICSNTSSNIVKDILNKTNLLKFFKGISGRDLCHSRKPSSIPYEYIINLFSMDKDNTVAVEDSTDGVISAKAAGLSTIGLGRVMSKEELGANFYIEILSDLKELLVE